MSKNLTKKDLSKVPENIRQIRNRIGLLVVLCVLIIILVSFNFFHQEFQTWSSIESNLNIFLLINLNVVLLIFVSLLIVRNLIKLLFEGRSSKLGFRLKFKLTLAFILVSSLPMILFFMITMGFLKNSLDFWFQGQYSIALKNAANVFNDLSQTQSKNLIHFNKIISADYLKKIILKPDQAVLENQEHWFRNSLEIYQLDSIAWYDSNFKLIGIWTLDDDKQKVWKPLLKGQVEPNSPSFPVFINSNSKQGQIKRAVQKVMFKEEAFFFETSSITIGSKFDDLVYLRKNLEEHKNLLNLEGPIRTNYVTYLLLFTVSIIFAGTWFGYYLARSIVEPIEILVEGTHRISAGDLDFQIDLQVQDEIGMLLESFNSMTKELQQNRKKLAISQTELMDSNKELEERNIFVELVVQNIQNGILFVDNSGYIRGINPYMTKLLQIKLPRIIGKHYLTVFSKEQAVLFDQLNQNLTEAMKNSIKKNTHISFDKSSLHVSMELFQLQSQKKKPIGRLLVVNDLTEIDRSTRARAWREVARRIAHEIKNPLTPIQLSAQRIRRKYLENIEDKELLDKCTNTIINEVYGLKNMVNEFSKFARLPEINPSPLNINQIIREVVDLFKPGLPNKIKLELNIDDSIPELLIDAEQMKRVFTNLIDNAIAATNKEGNIQLNSHYSRDLQMVIIDVIDNGIGIPKEMKSRIFDPYVTSKKDGTGLGLAIVQQIISDHGGFIRPESLEASGTKFTIELPV